MPKSRDMIPSGKVERGDRKQGADDVSKVVQGDVKTEGWPILRDHLGGCLRLPKRHPAWRRREAQLGSGTERENLAGDAKGKSTSGSNREAESTDAPERGGLPRSSDDVG